MRRGPNEWPPHQGLKCETMIQCKTTISPKLIFNARSSRVLMASTKPLSAKISTGENTNRPRAGLIRLPSDASAKFPAIPRAARF